jgi:hypothetical protein
MYVITSTGTRVDRELNLDLIRPIGELLHTYLGTALVCTRRSCIGIRIQLYLHESSGFCETH